MRDAATDVELLQRARQGDQRAARALYRRHVDGLTRWLELRRDTDALARSHDAMMVLLTTNYEVTSTVRACLYGIVRNRLLAHRRDAGRRRELDELHVDRLRAQHRRDVDAWSVEARVGLREAERRLIRAIEGLPPDLRALVELRLADLSLSEIAEVLGVAESLVKRRNERAMRALRASLGHGEGPFRGQPEAGFGGSHGSRDSPGSMTWWCEPQRERAAVPPELVARGRRSTMNEWLTGLGIHDRAQVDRVIADEDHQLKPALAVARCVARPLEAVARWTRHAAMQCVHAASRDRQPGGRKAVIATMCMAVDAQLDDIEEQPGADRRCIHTFEPQPVTDVDELVSVQFVVCIGVRSMHANRPAVGRGQARWCPAAAGERLGAHARVELGQHACAGCDAFEATVDAADQALLVAQRDAEAVVERVVGREQARARQQYVQASGPVVGRDCDGRGPGPSQQTRERAGGQPRCPRSIDAGAMIVDVEHLEFDDLVRGRDGEVVASCGAVQAPTRQPRTGAVELEARGRARLVAAAKHEATSRAGDLGPLPASRWITRHAGAHECDGLLPARRRLAAAQDLVQLAGQQPAGLARLAAQLVSRAIGCGRAHADDPGMPVGVEQIGRQLIQPRTKRGEARMIGAELIRPRKRVGWRRLANHPTAPRRHAAATACDPFGVAAVEDDGHEWGPCRDCCDHGPQLDGEDAPEAAVLARVVVGDQEWVLAVLGLRQPTVAGHGNDDLAALRTRNQPVEQSQHRAAGGVSALDADAVEAGGQHGLDQIEIVAGAAQHVGQPGALHADE